MRERNLKACIGRRPRGSVMSRAWRTLIHEYHAKKGLWLKTLERRRPTRHAIHHGWSKSHEPASLSHFERRSVWKCWRRTGSHLRHARSDHASRNGSVTHCPARTRHDAATEDLAISCRNGR